MRNEAMRVERRVPSQNAIVSVDEALALLRRSELPTVVVEGTDDVIVYRRMEYDFVDFTLSVLAVGGRDAVLEVFRRRAEIGSRVNVSFIVDLDCWIYSGVPALYVSDRLVLTTGYSLENDVFVDFQLVRLLDPTERSRFDSELAEFLKWYALALSRRLRGESEGAEIALHPNEVLDRSLGPSLNLLKPGEMYPESLRAMLADAYGLKLRGKSLFALLFRQLSRKGRSSRHSARGLLETAVLRKGDLLQKIWDAIEAQMSAKA